MFWEKRRRSKKVQSHLNQHQIDGIEGEFSTIAYNVITQFKRNAIVKQNLLMIRLNRLLSIKSLRHPERRICSQSIYFFFVFSTFAQETNIILE